MQSTYLNALGINNALGSNKQEFISAIISGVNPTHDQHALLSGRGTVTPKNKQLSLAQYPIKNNHFDTRNNRLLLAAFEEIAPEIEYFKNKFGKERIGIVVGTSTSGIDEGIRAYAQYKSTDQFPEDYDYSQQEIGNASAFLADYADITGIQFTISTACSSSAKAIIAADRLIKAGICDMVIAGGSDSLNELTLNGFDCLEAVASEQSNPFSINRKGINIGEGAALFIVSKEPSAIKLSGYGESSDATHITAPDPEGKGAKQAINQALSSANCQPEQIGYINLHGTGTIKNDITESLVTKEIFSHNPYCSTIKPLIGHTLGTAGAHSLGLCWLLLNKSYNPNQLLPKQVWDKQKDPSLATINLCDEQATWQSPYFMCNNFAFGGNNVSLIIERNKDHE